jgi:hypothetical protein
MKLGTMVTMSQRSRNSFEPRRRTRFAAAGSVFLSRIHSRIFLASVLVSIVAS